MSERIKVVVGVVEHPESKNILIAKRKANQHLAGYWEFPGGKIKDNESVTDALGRELEEELGIHVSASESLMQIQHDYKDKKVLLDVWRVTKWHGIPSGKENQEIQWVSKKQLLSYDFPEANRSILIKLLLPSLCAISLPIYNELSELTTKIEPCLKAGLKMLVLRLNDKSEVSDAECIQAIRELDKNQKLKLILNKAINEIDFNFVDGVHMKSVNLFDYTERPIDKEYLLGASCHNEAEVEQAIHIDADYLFISPVKPTTSHPEAKPIGWEKFRKLCELTHKPVYALGGMKPEDIYVAEQKGAQGIAMLNEIWHSADPFSRIKSVASA